MGKFQLNEIAIFVDIKDPALEDFEVSRGFFAAHHNQECTIVEILSDLNGYRIEFADHTFAHVDESCLRKRHQPGDYKSTLIPCDRQFPTQLDRWLNPLTEPVVREGPKGILQPFGFEGAV